MLFMELCSVYIFGFLVYVTDIIDCINGDSSLRNTLSDDQQNIGEKCFENLGIQCDPTAQYRNINGQCTCLKVPSRGMSGTAFTRLLPAVYKDNHSIIRTQIDGRPLNSPRVLSNVIFTDPRPDDPKLRADPEFTLNMLMFGQTMVHETIGTGIKPDHLIRWAKSDNNENDDSILIAAHEQLVEFREKTRIQRPSCCTTDNQRIKNPPPNCDPIFLPTNDRFYSAFKRTCLNMPRSKNTDDLPCDVGPVLPLNGNTCYIDASIVYGSNTETNKLLRLFKNGLLKYQVINGDMYPPNVQEPPKSCRSATNEDLCILTGDFRASTHPLIGLFQTILLRLHNIIALNLLKYNPHWKDNDNKIFFETRRIVEAMLTQIIYDSYIPNLIGKEHLKKINCCLLKDNEYNDVYDEEINPQIMTEFVTALKSLHSTIVSKICMYNEDRVFVRSWNFREFYNSINFITQGDNFTQLVIGMSTESQGKYGRFFSTDVTDQLFQVNNVGGDLESLDVDKARDFGVNGYIHYLDMIGQKMPQTWDDLIVHMPQNMVELLKTRYDSVMDVELFPGGILEYSAKNSMVGPVFQAIIGEQFCRLQKGDRLHFESGKQPYPFTLKQLEQIRKINLSLIYCYTSKIKRIQPDAFRLISENNQLQPCEKILGDFTLEPFTE